MTTDHNESGELRDRVRVSLLMALLVAMAGVAFVVTSVGYAYGENGVAPDAAVSPAVVTLLFLLHIGAYLASPWLTPTGARAATYLAVQAALAFGLSRLIDGPVPTIFLWLAWAEQTISYYPRRWPVIVAVATSLAIVDLAGDAILGQQIIAMVVTFAALFTAIYAVSFVRGVLVRREARDLLTSLRESQDELNHYASEIEERTLVAERQRLARELHDTLAQGLVGVTLQLEAADAQLDSGSAGRAQEILRQAMSRARETLTSARHAIDDLRIQSAEGTDLAGQLEAEVRRFSAATGVRSEAGPRGCIRDGRLERRTDSAHRDGGPNERSSARLRQQRVAIWQTIQRQRPSGTARRRSGGSIRVPRPPMVITACWVSTNARERLAAR